MDSLVDKILAEALLHERVINLFSQDVELRKKYVDQVWDLLQKSYAGIGGMHGSGFDSKEAMIKDIPLWKLIKRGDEITACIMYKDKNGRKRVAAGTNGADNGKKDWRMVGREELKTNRAYGEISGAPLAIQYRTAPNLADYAIPIEKVRELLPKDEIRPAPDNDPVFEQFPKLKPFFYQREIGGHWHTKVMIGKPHQDIKKYGTI